MTDLPPNVYRVRQRDFDAIPGSPWVYWVGDPIRALFTQLSSLREISDSVNGINTGANFRFVRYWWELLEKMPGNWCPFVSGGTYKKWYGNLDFVVNLHLEEMRELGGSALRAQDLWFREGITYVKVSSKGFNSRFLPPGYVFSSGGNCTFPERTEDTLSLLGLLNSGLAAYILRLLNPTVNFQTGDVERIPLNKHILRSKIESLVASCVITTRVVGATDESNLDFIAPPRWDTGLADLAAAEAHLAALEAQIDDEVYRLYRISDADRAAIEAELAGGNALGAEDGDERETSNGKRDDDADESNIENPKSEIEDRQELAVRWISYAVGIVLGRFTVGAATDPKIQNQKSKIGNAVYRREDFAIGSLPAPDEAEFDALVGPPERFAYIDEAGGRHLFPAEVEAALRALALPDGIAVLDAGHPRDLPTLVEKALTLMLDFGFSISDLRLKEDASASGNRQSAEVIRLGAGGDLRAFLSKDFFTQWHLKWYRKRPIYWPLQSAKRSYGFVLFHEKVEQYTLYILLRDYLDYKRNGVQLALGDLAEQREAQSGAARKRTERRIAEITALQEELAEFARTLDRLARAGYEPAPNWIDDGVLLRLAPLWEVIPLWKSEPRKAWEALEAGKYDWSHIAMRYWPERVKAACRENKSYAIAHNIFDF